MRRLSYDSRFLDLQYQATLANYLVNISGMKKFSGKRGAISFLPTYDLSLRVFSCLYLTLAWQHADMRNLLYDNAIAAGAKVRLGCPVVSIDPDGRTITLASGDTMTADVIIGADGLGGISQSVMDIEPPVPAPLNMYRCVRSLLSSTIALFLLARLCLRRL